jgi:hypothetical protein
MGQYIYISIIYGRGVFENVGRQMSHQEFWREKIIVGRGEKCIEECLKMC